MLFDILQSLFQAQAACTNCAGSALNAVTAAFATEGYYAQADLLEQIFFFGMDKFVIIAYVVAIVGGLTGMVLGMPPKNYLWFVIGPAVFHWLIGTTHLTYGVRWSSGFLPGGSPLYMVRDQNEVWKLSETGLADSNWVLRNGFTVSATNPPAGGPFAGQARVADFFAYWDYLMSDTVQQFITWLRPNYIAASSTGLANQITQADLIANLKWEQLEIITSAKLSNLDLADAFTHFWAGECGDDLTKRIDQRKLAVVTHARGEDLIDQIPGLGTFAILDQTRGERPLEGSIPPPMPLQNIIRRASANDPSYGPARPWGAPNVSASDTSSFENQAMINQLLGDTPMVVSTINGDDVIAQRLQVISCDAYFKILMHGFRWEAANIYRQFVAARPNGLTEEEFLASFMLGWKIYQNGTLLTPVNLRPRRPYFIQSLILIHLIRNELRISATLPDGRYTAPDKLKEGVIFAQRTGQQQSKFAELYSWSLMIPYFQGLLLYILALAYPFACILVVIPGMHKMIFTWMSFWAWVKLWDVGFAVVMVLERTVWGMLGSNVDFEGISEVAMQVAALNPTVVTTTSPGVETTWIGTTWDTTSLWGWAAIILNGPQTSYRLFDRTLALSQNIDFDLTNTYYIFIMSAMYFAVPALMGQLVLGAKAGMTSMLTQAMSGISQDAGGVGKSTTQGAMQVRQLNAQSAVEQESAAKAYRGGLAGSVLAAQNSQMEAKFLGDGLSIDGQKAGATQRALGMQADVAGRVSGATNEILGLGTSMAGRRRDALAERRKGDLGSGAEGADANAQELEARGRQQQISNPPTPPGVTGRPGGAGAGNTGGGTDPQLKESPQEQRAKADQAAQKRMLGATAPGPGMQERAMNVAAYGMDLAGMANRIGTTGFMIGNTDKTGVAYAKQADAQEKGTWAGMAASGQGFAADRMKSGAEYQRSAAQWNANRNWKSAKANDFMAVGGFASTMAAGQKPVDMVGMAMDGTLGGGNRTAAHWGTGKHGAGNDIGNAFSKARAKGQGDVASQFTNDYFGAVKRDASGAAMRDKNGQEIREGGMRSSATNPFNVASEGFGALGGTKLGELTKSLSVDQEAFGKVGNLISDVKNDMAEGEKK